MDWHGARAKARYITEHYHLKMPRLNVPIEALSGGNVQRIVFAREMAAKAKLLLAYYPTRGTDINAAQIIRTILLTYRNEGGTILLISEDLDQLLSISAPLILFYHAKNLLTANPENPHLNQLTHR